MVAEPTGHIKDMAEAEVKKDPSTELAASDEDVLVQDEVTQAYSACASCVFRPPSAGGRILVSTRKVLQGEVVARCKPQLAVGRTSLSPAHQAVWDQILQLFGTQDMDYWQRRVCDLVWSSLHSLVDADVPSSGFPFACITEDKQRRICLHFVPDVTPSPSTIELHKSLGLRCSPMKLARMVALWECNSLVHSSRASTAVLCLAFALMNHSCLPTVNWEFEGDEVVLRTTTDLAAGSELSVTYMEDENMNKSTFHRQEHLIYTGKRFTCGCVRCSGPELCRHVSCAARDCPGIVPLGSANADASAVCGTCSRTLTAGELAERVARESELDELLTPFRKPEEGPSKDHEGEEDDSESSEDEEQISDAPDPPEATFVNVDKISPEQLARIRDIASSGRWLAPAGHWLAHQAFGLLKDVAWSQKAGPAAVLACLDQRASFVRQSYPSTGTNYPPIAEHGWELHEAAEVLLSPQGWVPEWANEDKRKEAARSRLLECIAVLEPMCGPKESTAVEARKTLAVLGKASEKAKRGKKRERDDA